MFRSADATWGAVGLYRGPGPSGFTAAEADVPASVTTLIAEGIRTALIIAPVTAVSGAPLGDTGPAVVVIGPDDRPRLLTPAAEDRIEALGGIVHPRPRPQPRDHADPRRRLPAHQPGTRCRQLTTMIFFQHYGPASDSRSAATDGSSHRRAESCGASPRAGEVRSDGVRAHAACVFADRRRSASVASERSCRRP